MTPTPQAPIVHPQTSIYLVNLARTDVITGVWWVGVARRGGNDEYKQNVGRLLLDSRRNLTNL